MQGRPLPGIGIGVFPAFTQISSAGRRGLPRFAPSFSGGLRRGVLVLEICLLRRLLYFPSFSSQPCLWVVPHTTNSV